MIAAGTSPYSDHAREIPHILHGASAAGNYKIRDSLKIMIGGNAVNPEACAFVGADAWSKNAAEAVKTCGAWV
jgi:methanogenic corrinoid protein MtbC1